MQEEVKPEASDSLHLSIHEEKRQRYVKMAIIIFVTLFSNAFISQFKKCSKIADNKGVLIFAGPLQLTV